MVGGIPASASLIWHGDDVVGFITRKDGKPMTMRLAGDNRTPAKLHLKAMQGYGDLAVIEMDSSIVGANQWWGHIVFKGGLKKEIQFTKMELGDNERHDGDPAVLEALEQADEDLRGNYYLLQGELDAAQQRELADAQKQWLKDRDAFPSGSVKQLEFVLQRIEDLKEGSVQPSPVIELVDPPKPLF